MGSGRLNRCYDGRHCVAPGAWDGTDGLDIGDMMTVQRSLGLYKRESSLFRLSTKYAIILGTVIIIH